MMANLRSDIRKLMTVRSTYVLFTLAILLAAGGTFYLGSNSSPITRLSLAPNALLEIIKNTAGLAATFVCIIAILQVGHEYRYNTIMYTLAASSSRLKVFLSKALTLSVFSLIFGMVVIAVSLSAYFIGLSIRDASLVPQQFDWLPEIARVSFYLMAYGLLGFILAMLLRSIIGAIAVLLLLPAMIEPLLSLVLKGNAAYLPIASFDQIIRASIVPSNLSPNQAVITVLIYLSVSGLVAWLLFRYRDAN